MNPGAWFALAALGGCAFGMGVGLRIAPRAQMPAALGAYVDRIHELMSASIKAEEELRELREMQSQAWNTLVNRVTRLRKQIAGMGAEPVA